MRPPSKLVVPIRLWQTTIELLQQYTPRKLEAGCFWYGLRCQDHAVALSVGIPRQKNRPGNFEISGDDLAVLVEAASGTAGLVAVAQLHLHPGTGVGHSPWDDTQIVSRNVYSLVLPNYGKSPVKLDKIGVHRFESGKWIRLAAGVARSAILFAESLVDTR